MIKIINDITPYLEWIDGFVCDEYLSTPFCGKNKIMPASKTNNSLLLGVFDEQRLTGLFCLLVLDEEKYIETLFLYSREKEAYCSLTDYLSKEYPGYEIWFVINPKNDLLMSYLEEKQAFFYTAQKCMQHNGVKKEDVNEIIPYCDLYKDEYIRIHNKDGYWDGEKVLAKIDGFCVFLCIRDNRLVGYIDLSKGTETNEIMDIWILPEYRSRGIGTLLLKKAIFANKDNPLVLTVDIDNAPANHLYQKMGFEEIPANNSVTAKLEL